MKSMRTQFSIVTKVGNTSMILIIKFLENKGILPSMSRKGNSADNGMMESFFGILKSENVFMDLKRNLGLLMN